MEPEIKTLVVDDTVTYRSILSNLVSEMENTKLSGTASNGQIALSKIKLCQPDLVLLDMYMPVMDGLETLKQIKKDYPDIEVIMLSGFDQGLVNLTMKALENGALDFIAKPRGESPEKNIAELRSALLPVISLVKARKLSRQTRSLFINTNQKPVSPKSPALAKASLCDLKTSPQTEKKMSFPKTPRQIPHIDIVGLGVSTGGPNALLKIIPALSEAFPVPILAVQHMPPTFTASLAERLDKISAIKVVEASEGLSVEKGFMYIAPGGRHMVVRKGMSQNIISIVDSPPVNSCCPAVDVLFRSIPMVYGGNVLTVILTGMGKDGASGVASIRRKGGYSIIQDEASSVVWGMPGAIYKADAADEIVGLDDMAERIENIVLRGMR